MHLRAANDDHKAAKSPKKVRKRAASVESDKRVAYVSHESVRALKKMKKSQWTAVAELAEAVASGNWGYKSDEDSSSDDRA